jgi:hypothetical protein
LHFVQTNAGLAVLELATGESDQAVDGTGMKVSAGAAGVNTDVAAKS